MTVNNVRALAMRMERIFNCLFKLNSIQDSSFLISNSFIETNQIIKIILQNTSFLIILLIVFLSSSLFISIFLNVSDNYLCCTTGFQIQLDHEVRCLPQAYLFDILHKLVRVYGEVLYHTNARNSPPPG